MTDTLVVDFPFPGTRGSTQVARTVAARAADIPNVRDWGAKGDTTNGANGTDDTDAFQRAANEYNGKIIVPPGMYQVNGVDLSVNGNSYHRFVGAGVNPASGPNGGTTIIGDRSSGFLFDHNVNNGGSQGAGFQDMRIRNLSNSGGGCVRYVICDGFKLSGCVIQGFNGVEVGGIYPDGLTPASTIENNVFINSAGTGPAGSIGLCAGPHVAAISNTFVNFDIGMSKWGVGGLIANLRCEVNKTGLALGIDRAGTYRPVGDLKVVGSTYEANLTGVEIFSANNVEFNTGFIQHGDNALSGGHSLYGMKIHAVQNLRLNIVNITSGTGQLADFWISDDQGTPRNVYFVGCNGGLTKDGSWSLANLSQRDCVSFPSFATTFALLPGNSGNNTVNSTPTEGDQKIVTDCSNPTAARGTVVAGGGGASTTMTTVNGSAVVVVASASGIAIGQTAYGGGLLAGATVIGVSGTSITLSANAGASASGVSVLFNNQVTATYLGNQWRL